MALSILLWCLWSILTHLRPLEGGMNPDPKKGRGTQLVLVCLNVYVCWQKIKNTTQFLTRVLSIGISFWGEAKSWGVWRYSIPFPVHVCVQKFYC
jgi:hypothetical protein